MPGMLLDTCACLWLIEGAALSNESLRAMANAAAAGERLFVSPITAWEVAVKVAKKRLNLAMSPRNWFDRLLTHPGIVVVELSPAILIESTDLPGQLNNDPADRIIAATARHHGQIVLTRDRPLLDYARSGYLQALRC